MAELRNRKLISADMVTLGAVLRRARLLRQETLTDAGASSGVHPSQLSRLERGECHRFSKNLHKYANYLQIDLAVDQVSNSALIEKVARIASRSAPTAKALAAIVEALAVLSEESKC